MGGSAIPKQDADLITAHPANAQQFLSNNPNDIALFAHELFSGYQIAVQDAIVPIRRIQCGLLAQKVSDRAGMTPKSEKVGQMDQLFSPKGLSHGSNIFLAIFDFASSLGASESWR